MKRRFLCLALILCTAPLRADDWPQWGHDNSRNMVSTERHLPETFDPGKAIEGKPELDPATTKNIKWAVKLGDTCFGNPTVSGGKVFVGTDNHDPRNPARTGNYCVMMCFNEADGKFLWQLTVPRLAAGDNVDNTQAGLSSSPTVEGNRVYLVTNRCEVLCLTTDGLAKGNEGPFVDEAKYVGGEVGPTDADIVWRYDMRDELGIFPHQMTASSVLVVGDRIYIATSNGVDWTTKHIPNPKAPALICLDKKSGKLLGEERSGISARMFKCNWSSPAAGKVAGNEMIIFGGGDGFCYGFDPVPADGVLKEIWRCDCVPTGRRMKNGKPAKYGDELGPAEVIATPVLVNDRVYVGIGQHPELGTGAGAMVCIDATLSGDVTATGKKWSYEAMRQTASTASVVDGMVIVADHNGVVHCLDAETGKPFWTHDTEGSKTAASTLVADGKIYLGSSEGAFTILTAAKENKVIGSISFSDGRDLSSPVAANGVLYVATSTYLYAIQTK